MHIEYITSERFIHDMLRDRVEDVLRDTTCNLVLGVSDVQPYALLFPTRAVPADDGSAVTDVVLLDLSDTPKKKWHNLLKKAVHRVEAYALFLLEPAASGAMATLESPHGACRWHLIRRNVGDRTVLGMSSVENAASRLGYIPSRTSN